MSVSTDHRWHAVRAFLRSDTDIVRISELVVTSGDPGDYAKAVITTTDGETMKLHLMVYTRGELIDQIEMMLNEGGYPDGLTYLHQSRGYSMLRNAADAQYLHREDLASIVRNWEINDFVPAGQRHVYTVEGEDLFVSYI